MSIDKESPISQSFNIEGVVESLQARQNKMSTIGNALLDLFEKYYDRKFIEASKTGDLKDNYSDYNAIFVTEPDSFSMLFIGGFEEIKDGGGYQFPTQTIGLQASGLVEIQTYIWRQNSKFSSLPKKVLDAPADTWFPLRFGHLVKEKYFDAEILDQRSFDMDGLGVEDALSKTLILINEKSGYSPFYDISADALEKITQKTDTIKPTV